MIKLPGLIDPHVHLREPGATHKENFYTGSRAAIAGGFTFVLDMPNNPLPTITPEKLQEKIDLSKKAVCDIGFHYGTDGENTDTFKEIWNNPHVFGLKIYCNHTTGNLLVNDTDKIEAIFKSWESDKPILVHAEGPQLTLILKMVKEYRRRLHVCHISQASEVEEIRRAKNEGAKVSAGVTPHHLYLPPKPESYPPQPPPIIVGGKREVKLDHDKYWTMKPPLGTQKDQDVLWQGVIDSTIDLVETDHAPHTLEEKRKGPPAFGVPGLETAVSLVYKAVIDGKITEKRFRELFTIIQSGFSISPTSRIHSWSLIQKRNGLWVKTDMRQNAAGARLKAGS
jgi:dihydroorotase-like cyclic amidohydrolase